MLIFYLFIDNAEISKSKSLIFKEFFSTLIEKYLVNVPLIRAFLILSSKIKKLFKILLNYMNETLNKRKLSKLTF